jgi:hypothetical protein
VRQKLPEQEHDLGLQAAVARGWWWTHNHMTVAIGFNPALNSCELRIGNQFSPAAQIKTSLCRLRWELNRHRCHCRH